MTASRLFVVILTLVLPSYAAAQVAFDLEFERVSGSEIKVKVFTSGTSNPAEGAQGWSLSLAVEGDDFGLLDATTAATAGDLVANNPSGMPCDPGCRETPSFEITQIATCPGGNDGVVSAVVLSFLNPVTLDPNDSPHDILRIMVEGGEGCELAFEDFCQGSGQPVQNIFTSRGMSVRPGFGSPISCEGAVDSDGDGIPDDEDECPFSDLSPTVVINECNTGVENRLSETGCTVADLVGACSIRDCGGTVCPLDVACLTQLLRDGVVNGVEFGRIIRCAAPGAFRRADANLDSVLDISDVMASLGAQFLGGARPLCPDAADSNDDGTINISDASYLLGFLFLGSAPPPAPYPDPGLDPTDDRLPCL